MIILGEGAYFIIDDGLNIDFLLLDLLKKESLLFDFNSMSVLTRMFSGGLELGFIANKFKFTSILFYLFNSLNAYVVNSIIVRIIGFFGFYFFVKECYQKINDNIAILISISFAFIPIYHLSGITIIGLPLLFLAFYNLSINEKKIVSYLLIFVYVFYSSFILAPFIVFILIGWILTLIFKKRNILPFVLGLLFFVSLNLIFEYQLIFFSLSDNSHRSLRELYSLNFPSILGFFYGMFKKTFIGFFHPSWFISIPIFILIFSKLKSSMKYTIFLMMLVFLFNAIDFLRPYIENSISWIRVFDIGRINWLNPFLIFLMLITFISESKIQKTNMKFLYIIIFIQISINLIRNPEFSFNLIDNKKAAELFFNDDLLVKNSKMFKSNPYNINKISSLDFDDFFSEDFFSEVNRFINKPQNSYKVIGYGLDPSVLLYNGFYTLDGYYPNHDKDYHMEFNKIQPEFDLKASNRLILNYDKCINCSKDLGNFEIENLNLNFLQLKKMGADFLISAIKINDLSPELVFEKKFQNENYTIYLYKIV